MVNQMENEKINLYYDKAFYRILSVFLNNGE